MENATYALRIAAGVLIALMVTSLLMFGFNRINRYKKQEEISKKDEQTVEFNKEFESYNKRVVTGYELISLANYTNDINERYQETDGFTVVKIYIIMMKDANLVNSDGTSANYIKRTNGEKTYDLIDFVKNGLNLTDTSKKEYRNNQTSFKKLYFDCNNVEYDDNNGRVCEMDFNQIKRIN